MNSITVKYEDPLLSSLQLQSFSTYIDHIQVNITYALEKNKLHSLTITTSGVFDLDKHQALISHVCTLLFLILGAYPAVKKVSVNNKDTDLDSLSPCYETSKEFKNARYCICHVTPEVLSQTTIDGLRNFRPFPIESLQHLVSGAYTSVVHNHKITLLLHVVDGVCTKGCYAEKVKSILDRTFFEAEMCFKCEILSLLGFSEEKYVSQLVDTRHWYSHFLKDTERKNRLCSGKMMRIQFELLFYSIRLYLLQELKVPVEEGNVRNFYYLMHDWIADVMDCPDIEPKSGTYQLAKILKQDSN